MTLKAYLENVFDSDTAGRILEKSDRLYDEMLKEQKPRLSKAQLKPAKSKILKRISVFLAMRDYEDEDKVLVHMKEFYYPRFEKLAKMLNKLTGTALGRSAFRKFFTVNLKKDVWKTTVKRSDGDALVFDITECIYKSLCDHYGCSRCCELFCDGDWMMFGGMRKLKFERKYTLGYGDHLCDFRFTSKKDE